MNTKLSNEKIKSIILDLENKYAVHTWEVNGIYIWPYVRNKLYIFLLNYGSESNVIAKTKILESKNKSKTSVISRLKNLVRDYLDLIIFYKSLKSKDIIFFSVLFHRVNYRGLFFNRFFDPMIEKHNLENKVYVMEYQKNIKNVYHPEVVIPIKKFIDIFRLKEKFRKISSKKENRILLPNYNDFYVELESMFNNINNINISQSSIVSWTLKIKSTSRFFTRVFKKIKPKKVIFLSYNSYDDFYAAIYAANNLGIRTIDFQHGFQTNYHMVYSHWNKHPKNNYKILPFEYWNWDSISSDNILDWSGAAPQGVKSYVVGQPYLAYWQEKADSQIQKSEIIFYSLGVQDLDFLFPNQILKILKKNDKHWIIRLHPRSSIKASEIHELLIIENINISKVTIEGAFNSPLPETLAKSFAHITHFSGCVIEAKMMGIPSIIVSEKGGEYFSNYIDNISVYYNPIGASNFEEKLLEIFSNIHQKTFKPAFGSIINPIEI